LFLVLAFVLNLRKEASAKSDLTNIEVKASTESDTTVLLTPERVVKAGESLSGVKLKELYWPKNQLPEGAITDAKMLDGMFSRVTLSPHVPLQQSHLTKELANVALPVTPGNRAVAIEIDEISGIEGHALPGTRVDVVLTYYSQGQLTSKMIVQNARIISAGGDTTAATDPSRNAVVGSRRNARTISLDVGVKDALVIQTSRQLGRLSLLMRNSEDNAGAPIDSLYQGDIDDNPEHRNSDRSKPECKIGRMKAGGKEYLVDCDGALSEIRELDRR
jgi:pilus assembly protein CpaB